MLALASSGCDLILLSENKSNDTPPLEAGVPADAPPNLCFGDDFNTPPLNGELWQEIADSSTMPAKVEVRQGALRVTLTAGPSGSSTYRNGVFGKTAFDFTGATLEVRVRPANLANPLVETAFVLDVAGTSGTFTMSASASKLAMKATTALPDKIVPYGNDFVAWRIRHEPAAKTFVYEVLIQGVGWKEQRRVVADIPTTITSVQLYAEAVMNGGNDAEAVFDEVTLFGDSCVQSLR